MAMDKDNSVRLPIAEGILYPSGPVELEGTVDSLLAGARKDMSAVPIQENAVPRVLIVPHASYELAGAVIAAAFAMLEKPAVKLPYDRVVLLSTVHRDHSSHIYIPGFRYFRIPGADLEIDGSSISRLAGLDPLFTADDIPFMEEHAQEIILPFIHRCVPRSKIIPVMLGDNSNRTASRAARALRNIFDSGSQGALFVVSTNISGFSPAETAREQAEAFVSAITSEPEEIPVRLAAMGRGSICGTGAVQCAVECCGGSLGFQKIMSGSSGPVQPEQREVRYGAFCGYSP